MSLEHSRRDDLSAPSSSSSERRSPAPGKRTLTMGLPRTRAETAARPEAVPPEEAASPGTVDVWMASAMRPDLFLDEEPQPIQRKASGAPAQQATPPTPAGGGQPLPAVLQAKMSRAFATDFSAVRVHEGPQAAAVGALAYTQGTDLFFAPGQYDPHSEKGQELIGHELAHSVQQSQGRVQATAQAKGQAINADPSLEREADELGARAARGEPARGGAPAGPLGALSSAVAQHKAVIQRKVGFEFETGWFVDRIPFDYTHDDVEQPDQKPVPFAKKDVVSSASTSGFRLEADEAEDGRSELEIVIRPPIEESKEGLKTLLTIMDDIAQLGEALKKHYNADGRSFPLSDVTGAPFDHFTAVTPRAGDAELKAGPQVTMGLDLAAIPKLNNIHPKQLTKFPRFDGFVSLVKQYVGNGTTKGGAMSYPKMMAEPLLSRTSFVKLLDLVEPQIKQQYKHAPQKWVPDVLHLAGLPLEVADQDMLARGIVADEHMDEHVLIRSQLYELDPVYEQLTRELHLVTGKANELANKISSYKEPSGLEVLTRALEPSKEKLQQQFDEQVMIKFELSQKLKPIAQQRDPLVKRKQEIEKHAGFTVGQWLSGLLKGTDLLPTIEDAESLGEFGDRTEQVGPEQKTEGGIFEWRGDQKKKIPVTQWPKYAISSFESILKLHGH